MLTLLKFTVLIIIIVIFTYEITGLCKKVYLKPGFGGQMNIGSEIKEFLGSAGKPVLKNLAYWALTSKIEEPFRDQFAAWLFNRHKNHIVSREFTDKKIKRVDLAILDKDAQPLGAAEFKACYTFNLVDEAEGKKRRYQDRILDDYNKHKKLKHGVPVSYVLLAVNVHNREKPGQNTGHLKYWNDVSRFLNTHAPYDPKKLFEVSKKYLKAAFEKKPISLKSSGQVPLGTAYGITISLDYFVFEEKKR